MDNSLLYNLSNSILNKYAEINFFPCCKCNLTPILLNINPYKNIIKYKCPIHGNIAIKLNDYFISLNNILKDSKIGQHIKCYKHIGNNIICFNYEKEEYYCKECYLLNKDKEYDIRFFKYVNIPNEINTNEIEFIDYNNNDDIIEYLKMKNVQYYNIINNYYNMININNILINSYKNKTYNNNIDIINIKHYINILKSYDIKEEEYINNINNQELKQINNIKYLNKKYSLNLTEVDNYINLIGKNLSNEGFKDFNNNIGKEKNPIIEIIDFSENNISNIDSLIKANYYNLKELYLHINKISNINALSFVNFGKLKILNLSYNNIIDLKPLIKGNFYNLEKLYLYYNRIKDISILQHDMFTNLKRIDLSHNIIDDINVMKLVKFENLEKLLLGNNNIINISVFNYIKFTNLIVLDLSGNKIEDIGSLENNFPKIKELYLYNNAINQYIIKNKDIIINFKSNIEKFGI